MSIFRPSLDYSNFSEKISSVKKNIWIWKWIYLTVFFYYKIKTHNYSKFNWNIKIKFRFNVNLLIFTFKIFRLQICSGAMMSKEFCLIIPHLGANLLNPSLVLILTLEWGARKWIISERTWNWPLQPYPPQSRGPLYWLGQWNSDVHFETKFNLATKTEPIFLLQWNIKDGRSLKLTKKCYYISSLFEVNHLLNELVEVKGELRFILELWPSVAHNLFFRA